MPTSSEREGRFRLVVAPDYEGLSQRAADLIAEEVRANPALLLCAASGATPIRTYELLAEQARHGPTSFERLRVLKLDEWGGLAKDDPATCEAFLRRHLLEPLRIPDDRYIGFQGDARDPQAECARIRLRLAKQGPIDICVLGLGLNGHLAFNEPADELEPGPHVAALSGQSLQHSMLRKAREVVRYGLTLGMADILLARQVLLLVNGPHKREPLHRLWTSGVSTRFPASFLWLHGDATCLCDAEAAAAPDPDAP